MVNDVAFGDRIPDVTRIQRGLEVSLYFDDEGQVINTNAGIVANVAGLSHALSASPETLAKQHSLPTACTI